MNKLLALIENAEKIAISVNNWLNKIDWTEVQRRLDHIANQIPKEFEKLVLSLMDRGWFIWIGKNDSLADFTNMFDRLFNNDIHGQDNYMMGFTKNSQKALIELLLANHPQRAQQITDSFEAHNNNLYYASVPSLIALCEGVCRDYFPQIGLFAKRKNKHLNILEPITVDLVNNITFLDVFDEIFLKPLKVNSKITKSIKKPTELEEQSFNRHLIMHGISTKYGTEINSYKAISMLYYVFNAMNYLKEEKTLLKKEIGSKKKTVNS